MSSGNSFNFGNIQQTASGDGSVNQIGNNTATTTVNKGDGVPTVPEVFGAIEKALPAIEATADDDSAEEIQEAVLRPLQTFAELPAEEQKEPEKWEQAQSLISRLVPYAPAIGKGLAVFGEAALSALASRNPIVAGILAVCKTTTKEEQPS